MSSSLQLPRVIGHRGAATYAPENTLASLREARRRGAAWVEFDVKLSADNVPLLMHDESLRRTAGDDRAVAALPWSQLADIDVGTWFDRGFAGERVPSLEAAIDCLAENGLGANIELKPSPIRESGTASAVVALLRRRWPTTLPPPLLSSFKDASLAAALRTAPEYDRALLLGEVGPDWLARARAVEAVAINVDGRKLGAGRAREIKDAGFQLAAYTINDPALARTLVAMGVDCIITDTPDVIIAAVGR
jgi:glycerophosphoryl diester phosphodiesterase